MLSAFANAFRTPDLRRKILFTLFILAVFRLTPQGKVELTIEKIGTLTNPIEAV